LYTLKLVICSFTFDLLFLISTLLYAPLVIIFAPLLTLIQRQIIVAYWSRWILWLLKVICGIQISISGSENITAKPFIVLSNHQSTFEALFLQQTFIPSTTAVKRELLHIPLFGWVLALLKPICIDREHKTRAGLRLLEQGTQALNNGQSVILFPGGTRVSFGENEVIKMGGFRLASVSKYSILPIAHNAGICWPARQWLKYPGTIDVFIGQPIITNTNPRELVECYTQWHKQFFEN